MRALIGRPFVFRRPGGALVKIDALPAGIMLLYRQSNARDREAGGVLLGRYVRGCGDVVVDEATIPMRGDRRTRTTYHREAKRHQEIIDARWSMSAGTCQYLGEWHTHPETDPTPSGIDLSDWRRRLRHDEFDSDTLLFVIVGTETVRVWEGHRRSREIHVLEPSEPYYL